MRSGLRSLLALVSFAALATACSHDTSTGPSSASVDGVWTGSTSYYSTVRIDLIERADDHALFGTWTGTHAKCIPGTPCADSGIVFEGARNGGAMTFGLTALNTTRSLAIDATFDGVSIVGTSALTDDGAHFATERIRLERE